MLHTYLTLESYRTLLIRMNIIFENEFKGLHFWTTFCYINVNIVQRQRNIRTSR